MTPGVILAGGLSRRMGGGDKTLADLGGRPLMAHVIARLEGEAAALAVNANGDPERFARFGLPVIADVWPGHAGPLAGVLTAMDWAARGGAALVLTVPGDTPFLPRGLGRALAAARAASGLPVAMAVSRRADGGLSAHPVCALWPVALRDGLRDALGDGTRRVRDWAGRQGCAEAEFPDATAFMNVNTPEDLARASALAQAGA